jgi:Fe-S cluster biogenesis protein NfuA/nitrite reductase/ring-hydroxylating ferredoxin subunit
MAVETDTARAPEGLVARVQELTEALEQIADPFARSIAEDLVGAIVDLYGEGLARIGSALRAGGEAGASIRDELVEDGVVASLLLIHGLHPVPLEERVVAALDTVRPYMESHGGNIEILAIEDGVAHLRLEGSCSGCPASRATLELAIEQALTEAAPDLMGLEVEGVVEEKTPEMPGFQLPMVEHNPEPVATGWQRLPAGVNGAPVGSLYPVSFGGTLLVVANVGGSLLAYRDECASCKGELHNGQLKGGVLHCAGCGHRFYLPGAGRSLDGDELQLQPVPLLADESGHRVALG